MSNPSTLTVLNSLLSPGWLSQQVGLDCTPLALRVKPDTSLLLGYRLQGQEGKTSGVGWLRLFWEKSASKALKHQGRAQKLGFDAPVTPIREGELAGMVLQTGSIHTDPKLMTALAATGLLGDPATRLLRYNPARRVVLGRGQQVLRVLPQGQSPDWSLHAFLQEHLPVPPLVPAEGQEGQALTFVGDRDLSAQQSAQDAQAAGALFAALHSLTPCLPQQLARTLTPLAGPGTSQLTVHADLLQSLAPDLADRCKTLAQRLAPIPGEHYLSHGDASPDQILAEGHGPASHYWLTDFDRATLAPTALDLGSYLLTSPTTVHAAFLEGYQAAGGQTVSPDTIRLGMAHALALRLLEPLRSARPTWRKETAHNITRLENLL